MAFGQELGGCYPQHHVHRCAVLVPFDAVPLPAYYAMRRLTPESNTRLAFRGTGVSWLAAARQNTEVRCTRYCTGLQGTY